ncbi:hypothetical protein [Aeromonas aquatica]|uniref:hypothetical protein n=1 Tax=Aeromonas aquatica TaxID=558964 RepID=UPI000AC56A6F|nr:hypothetical protein [Aeromonas aquatica]
MGRQQVQMFHYQGRGQRYILLRGQTVDLLERLGPAVHGQVGGAVVDTLTSLSTSM